MAQGRHGPAAEQLLRLLETQPQRAEARDLLRQCLEAMSASRRPKAVGAGDYLRRAAMLALAMALPWAAAVVTAWLMLGFEHYLVPCLLGAGCMIVPTALMLPLPQAQPAKRQFDTLAVIFGLGWLAVSMLYVARGTSRPEAMLGFALLLAGSVLASLAVLLSHRRQLGGGGQ